MSYMFVVYHCSYDYCSTTKDVEFVTADKALAQKYVDDYNDASPDYIVDYASFESVSVK